MPEKPRIARRLAWAGAAVLLVVGAAVAAVWLSGRTVWTDGQSTRVPGRDARLREVLWAAARPLEAAPNSAEQQYEPSLSPDGTELYFVRGKPGRGTHIYVSYRRDNAWTSPVRVDAVTGPTDDLGPRVTSDGRFLLFASDRPGGLGGYDLWAAPRQQGGWGAPFNLGPAVNTEFNELNPDPTPDGRRLIFSTNRKAAGREQKQAWRGTIRETGSVDYDLWIATLSHDPTVAAATTQPTPAPTTRPAAPALAFAGAAEIPGVNTDFSEGASCMSPAGDFLYFASNRPGGLGKFDLYRCRVREGAPSGPVENLGPPINTPENEADPAMAMAGFRIVFSSDRDSPAGVYALYSSDSREVFALREGRPFPRLGWSAWSLLLSALLLIPLILALRGLEGRHLNTLQRCLVLSLLLHAALTCVFSFVLVSRDVARGMRRGSGGEIALNLILPKDLEIGLAVRGQLSSPSDLPFTAAGPVPVARVTAQTTPTLGPSPVRIDAPANAASATTLPPPPVTVAAKPLAPTDLPRVAPANLVTNSAAPILTDLGPRDVAEKFTQATPGPSATAVQPRPVNPTEVATPQDTRPLRVFDSVVPTATPSAAARIPIDPPAVAARQSPAPSSDATADAPRAMTSGPLVDLPIADLTTQDATAARLKAEAPPPTVPSDTPRPAARPLAGVANGPAGAPLEVAPSAAPVRPTTAPTGVALASAASTRPAPPQFPASLADVQPARTAETAPAVALTPSDTTRPLSSDARISTPNTPTEPPRTAEVSVPLNRQALANSTSPPPPPPLSLSTSFHAPPVSPVRSPTASALRALAPQAPRPPDVTGGGGNVVAPLATRSAAPLELPPTAAVLSPSVAKVSEPAGDQQPNLNPADAKLASARATAPEVPSAPAPITTAQPPPPSSRDQTSSLASPPPLPRGTTPLLPTPPPPSPAAAVIAAAVPLDPPAGVVATPPSAFPRSPEQRQARVEKLGGNAQSESAVDRGLAYLAANQEPDGRWTLVLDDDRPTGRRPRSYHDMANTGLAVLAFLARDHAPGKPGPYPTAVAKALDYLIDQQDNDGDLRGPSHLRGEGSRRGDMYDHAIATLALAEAALITGGDRRYTQAALRGARFIVAAQDPRSGGWRYVPGEYGDSSVFGWQLMALHAAEQLGFKTPDRTRQLARGYVRLTSQGARRMLAGYQPGKPATPAMTAEILYGRMLLGERLDPDDIAEATDFLANQVPDPREPSLYYWYYASLCMLQIHSPHWERWNARTRDALIDLQTRDGLTDGSWDADPRYAERGGRIYMTAIAVLTLEVYYRYLPLPDPPAAPK